MKDLQPAMKEDKIYIKFEIHAEKNVGISELVDAFWDVTIRYLGTKELSKAQPWLIANKFNEEEQEGVIQVNKEYLSDLRASLTVLDKLGSKDAFLTIEKVSGSISNL